MRYSNTFELVSTEAKGHKISCILIGGFAVGYYKVVRQTMDVDFLITRADFEKFLPVLKEQGYQVVNRNDISINLKSTQDHLIDLDCLFIEPDVFDKVRQDGREIEIFNQKFWVPSLNHLIALKLHSIKSNPKRELRDLPDIIGLIDNNKVDTKSQSFADLCLKFGTPELLKKIRDFMETK